MEHARQYVGVDEVAGESCPAAGRGEGRRSLPATSAKGGRAPPPAEPYLRAMSDPNRRPILIWGAGAMGGTIGACLARAGHAVRFVDRAGDHVEAMRANGLEIRGPVETFRVDADAFTPAQLEGRYGAVLLCVKAHHTADAVEELAPYVDEDGYVVSIQNGLNEPVIAARVGASRTLGAFVNFGADYLEPGVVHWGGRGAVVVGELDGRTTARVETLHRILRDFEPRAVLTDNIYGYLWGKLAYAALLFATALTDDPIAEVLADRRWRALNVAIAREVCLVARENGVRLESFDGFDPSAFTPGATDQRAERSLDDLVAFNRRSAKTHSGIWRDLAVRKRKTEVDAQLGPVVEAGRTAGVATPLTARIIAQIHDIEEGRRVRSRTNLDELEEARER